MEYIFERFGSKHYKNLEVEHIGYMAYTLKSFPATCNDFLFAADNLLFNGFVFIDDSLPHLHFGSAKMMDDIIKKDK